MRRTGFPPHFAVSFMITPPISVYSGLSGCTRPNTRLVALNAGDPANDAFIFAMRRHTRFESQPATPLPVGSTENQYGLRSAYQLCGNPVGPSVMAFRSASPCQ